MVIIVYIFLYHCITFIYILLLQFPLWEAIRVHVGTGGLPRLLYRVMAEYTYLPPLCLLPASLGIHILASLASTYLLPLCLLPALLDNHVLASLVFTFPHNFLPGIHILVSHIYRHPYTFIYTSNLPGYLNTFIYTSSLPFIFHASLISEYLLLESFPECSNIRISYIPLSLIFI